MSTASESLHGALSLGTGRVGVALIHGFTGSPQALRPLAQHLAAAGLRVEVPLLPGHGTSWQDLQATKWPDWYAEAERTYLQLADECDQVAVVGLSMGGSLAVHLAASHPVSSLVLINPSLGTSQLQYRFLGPLSAVVASLPAIGDDIAKPGVSEGAYPRTPLKAAYSLTKLWKVAQADLPSITCPVLLLKSRVDHVVDDTSARLIRGAVSSPLTEVTLEKSYHVATLDYDADAIAEVTGEFIAGNVDE